MPPSATDLDCRVLIVGTGFAGLGMAIRLAQQGRRDFLVLEQADDVGGTWRDNTYPGAACDVPSHLYSFSFAPNPHWTRHYAPQPEILAYMRGLVARYDLGPHLRFGREVTGARFDATTDTWRVHTAGGETWRARVLVAGCGGLSRPKLPGIEGRGTFEGPAFHSARWRHGVDLEGQRVGVIGTGASGIQVVPGITESVARLAVFQRTPPWIIPRKDRPIGPRERAVYARVPAAQWLHRQWLYWSQELFALGFTRFPGLLRWAQGLAERHLRDSVADPDLRAKLTPDYTMGCKRVLLSDDYYPALQREHVDLVTDPIAAIEPRGVRTERGFVPLDVLVYATGFRAAEDAAPFEVIGRDGQELSEAWRAAPEAYLGTTVSGFPNLFLIVGPNTGLGHSSMILMIESQVAYVLDALRQLEEHDLAFLDVLPEAQDRYNRRLQERMARTVWQTGGCTSWYQTSEGRNTTLWPGFTWGFRLATRRLRLADYDTSTARTAARSAVASTSPSS